MTILHRAANQPNASGSVSFKDVESGSWYAAGVQWAAANGLVTGYDDLRQLQEPHQHSRSLDAGRTAVGSQVVLIASGDNAHPVSPSHRFGSPDVDYVVSNGLMTGTNDNTFSPNASLTRGMHRRWEPGGSHRVRR